MLWMVLTGCYVASLPLQRADTLQAGQVEAAAEGLGQGGLPIDGPPLLAVKVAARAGMSDRIDLGGRFGHLRTFAGSSSVFGEVQSKFQLTDDQGVILALAPSLEYRHWFGGEATFTRTSGDRVITQVFSYDAQPTLGLRVPLLIGIPIGRDHQIVLGPGVEVWKLDFEQATPDVYAAKVSVGVVTQFGPFRLQPEVGLIGPAITRDDGLVWGVGYMVGVAGGFRSR